LTEGAGYGISGGGPLLTGRANRTGKSKATRYEDDALELRYSGRKLGFGRGFAAAGGMRAETEGTAANGDQWSGG